MLVCDDAPHVASQKMTVFDISVQCSGPKLC